VDGAKFDRPDLATVNTLARLQLAAQRLGWTVRLRNPTAELCALLDFVGLRDVVGLPLEPLREPEGGEQLGVEEVVEAGDPPP
jgi:hypothetical protein